MSKFSNSRQPLGASFPRILPLGSHSPHCPHHPGPALAVCHTAALFRGHVSQLLSVRRLQKKTVLFLLRIWFCQDKTNAGLRVAVQCWSLGAERWPSIVRLGDSPCCSESKRITATEIPELLSIAPFNTLTFFTSAAVLRAGSPR